MEKENLPTIKSMEVDKTTIEDMKELAKNIRDFTVKHEITTFRIDNYNTFDMLRGTRDIDDIWMPKLMIEKTDSNFTFKHNTDIDPDFNKRLWEEKEREAIIERDKNLKKKD